MENVCILRYHDYIKSKTQFPNQHNFRILKNYGNKNIDSSLTYLNTCIVNNSKNGETYLTAFNRMYESGEFKGHSSPKTTERYLRNIHTNDETVSILDMAMNC